MLKLTDYEQKMLEGEMGAFKQSAMKFIVRYAGVLGAEELCGISRATMFIGAQRYLDCYQGDESYEKIFSQFYLCSDETPALGKVADSCDAQTCVGACDITEYKRTRLSEEFHKRNAGFLRITRDMDVKIVDCCAPYLLGWIPLMGEHFVSTESSNVVVSNTIFGARGNADGVEAAVCAAITGRIPKWGMHVKENRYATALFRLNYRPSTQKDWDLLGYTMGRLLPKSEVPVLVGDFERPDINRMRQFCSSICVTSAAEICHVVGLTPEAHTLDMALGGKKPKTEIEVSEKDIEESLSMVCDAGVGPVDYISIGCPHLSLDEIREIAYYLEGKKLGPGVELLIWTAYPIKEMANMNGYTKTIEDSGAFLLTGSCPVLMREESHGHAKAMVMSGVKQAHTIKHQTKAPVYFGSVKQCMDAALSGRWEG